ncbi:MAG: nicotinate-nucleotide adenylyltransferase [Chitinophagaceae bacterium]|nr:nicotinate-nucleotide adenylyltransferase [Chitinophagaceae bacterium]
MKIGLYFGSFNPIHIGHLIIANHIVEHTDLDKIWFVISPQNPLKPASSLLNEYHRLHLVQLAIENDTRFKASNIEFKLPRPSYTIDTLTYLSEQYSKYSFSIIMGSDSYNNLENWKNYELLLSNYPIIVYSREGFVPEKKSEKSTFLQAPLLNISSTFIREQIRQGKSVRYLVPDLVFQELEAANYYK